VPTSVRQVYLIRHARAEERGPAWPNDELRPLTAEGTERFARAVRGLLHLDAAPTVVMTSPLLRAHQTAEILAKLSRPQPRVVQVPALAPGGAATDVMQALVGARRARRLAVVGHEPDLGALAAHILRAQAAIPFKKGAMCRIDLSESTAALVWFLPPAALRSLARS
jgi:phosphohistidine phosphatase